MSDPRHGGQQPPPWQGYQLGGPVAGPQQPTQRPPGQYPGYPGGYQTSGRKPPKAGKPWKHLVGYPAAVVVALAVGAAAGSAGTPNTVAVADPAASSTAKAGDVKAATGKASTPATAKLPDGVYRFGQTVKFKDGSALKASGPVSFTPDQYASGGEKFKSHVKFKVTFTNNSGKVYDPSLTTGAVSSGDTEGESVYQEGLDAPDNKILPGKSVTWWMGYGVKSAKTVTLTVSMGFLDGYGDVLYTNEQ